MAILFYSTKGQYGGFSNFSRHSVEIYDRVWLTSEHAFQAMKFWPEKRYMDLVHQAETPRQAATYGRDRSFPLRPDWDKPPTAMYVVLGFHSDKWIQPNDGIDRQGAAAEPIFSRLKDVFMFQVCRAKFTQHRELNNVLLATGDEPLIEETTDDTYWGCGTSKVGQNKLGRILMLLRESFKTE